MMGKRGKRKRSPLAKLNELHPDVRGQKMRKRPVLIRR